MTLITLALVFLWVSMALRPGTRESSRRLKRTRPHRPRTVLRCPLSVFPLPRRGGRMVASRRLRVLHSQSPRRCNCVLDIVSAIKATGLVISWTTTIYHYNEQTFAFSLQLRDFDMALDLAVQPEPDEKSKKDHVRNNHGGFKTVSLCACLCYKGV